LSQVRGSPGLRRAVRLYGPPPEPVETARAAPPERSRGYVIGVDLAKGKDYTAKAYISRA